MWVNLYHKGHKDHKEDFRNNFVVFGYFEFFVVYLIGLAVNQNWL